MTSPFTDEELARMARNYRRPKLAGVCAELLEARRDARRYRWLRDRAECHRPNKNIRDELCYFDLNPSDFETVIDAALREGK